MLVPLGKYGLVNTDKLMLGCYDASKKTARFAYPADGPHGLQSHAIDDCSEEDWQEFLKRVSPSS